MANKKDVNLKKLLKPEKYSGKTKADLIVSKLKRIDEGYSGIPNNEKERMISWLMKNSKKYETFSAMYSSFSDFFGISPHSEDERDLAKRYWNKNDEIGGYRGFKD